MSYRVEHPDIEGDAVIPERALATYANKGWLITGRTEEAAPPDAVPQLTMPNRSDSAGRWRTYAVALGADNGLPYEQAMAMTRDELADHYRPAPKADTPAKTAPKES